MEVTTPLRMDVSLTRNQLLEALTNMLTAAAKGEAVFPAALLSKVDAAIRQSILPEIEIIGRRVVSEARQTDERDDENAAANSRTKHAPDSKTTKTRSRADVSLFQLLIGWRQQDALGPLLRQLSLRTLTLWHAALMKQSSGGLRPLENDRASEVLADDDSELSAGEASPLEIIRQVARTLPADVTDAETVLRYRIAATVEVAFRTGLAPASEQVRNALDLCLPLGEMTAPGEPVERPPDPETNAPTEGKHAGNEELIRRIPTEERLLAIVQQVAERLPADVDDLNTIIRYRIAAAAEVALRTGLAPDSERVQKVLDSWLPTRKKPSAVTPPLPPTLRDDHSPAAKDLTNEEPVHGWLNPVAAAAPA